MTCNNPDHKDGAWETVAELGKQVADLVRTLSIVACNLALAQKEGRDIGGYGRLAVEAIERKLK